MFDEQRYGSFDLNEGRVKRQKSQWDEEPNDTPKPVKASKLDSEEMEALRRRLMSYYVQELERQADNRHQMAVDQDFYDNIQWDEADAAELRNRGQMPLVYNVISTSVNWLLGSEKRGRTDFKVLPRRKEDAKPAERKSSLLKYLSDVNRTQFHRSRAFEDAVKVGIGWLEDGVQDDVEGEPVYSRYESWRNMLWDSAANEFDLSDARYIFRSKWVDLDIAIAMFPERKAVLEMAAIDSIGQFAAHDEHGDDAMDSQETELSHDFGGDNDGSHMRRRVRLIEGWVRRPIKVKRIRGGNLNGEIFEKDNPLQVEELNAGNAELVERVMMRVHVAIFCSSGMLWYSPTPYRHNRFPFTPVWGYRRGRDGMPYGIIRGLRDIQQDINKRASKALYILSTNKVIMEKGAVDDIDEFREEVSRPDAIIEVNNGKRLELNAERELASAHIELMSRSIAMVQQQSGVTDENLGRRTNATSGVAISRRQEQGALATAGFFDNLRLAAQLQGELQLSLIEQYFSDQKSFRITNMRGTPEYIVINDGLPENDIVRSKADFIISESDWNQSMRQAQVEELLALISQLAPVAPQAVLVTLDLVVEAMDIPMRDELVRRLRQINGQRDPDAEEPTPEEIQQAQKAAQAEAMQMAAMEADIAKKQADAQKAAAEAQRIGLQAQQILGQMAGQNVSTQKAALEAALAVLQMPPAVPVADTILQEAGFKGRSEMESEQALSMRAMEAEQQAALEQQTAMQEQALMEQQQMQQQEPSLIDQMAPQQPDQGQQPI